MRIAHLNESLALEKVRDAHPTIPVFKRKKAGSPDAACGVRESGATNAPHSRDTSLYRTLRALRVQIGCPADLSASPMRAAFQAQKSRAAPGLRRGQRRRQGPGAVAASPRASFPSRPREAGRGRVTPGWRGASASPPRRCPSHGSHGRWSPPAGTGWTARRPCPWACRSPCRTARGCRSGR